MEEGQEVARRNRKKQNSHVFPRLAKICIMLTILIQLFLTKIDKLVKSPKLRHACEGSPELFENTGFPPSRE